MKVSRLIGLAAVGVMAFAAACGSNNTGKDTTTGTDTVVPNDSVITVETEEDIPRINKLCETDEQCQTEKGGPNWACAKCETEWSCIEITLLTDGGNGCFNNMNCGSGKYCDKCTKECKPAKNVCESCESDDECEGADQMTHCVDKFTYQGVEQSLPGKICAPWCTLATGICPISGAAFGSYVCGNIGDDNNGVCVPSTLSCESTIEKCKSDEECTEKGFICYPDLGICGCKDSLSCDIGKACHPVTHQCMTGCADDNECGDGTVCSQGLCIPPCTGTLEKNNVTGCTADAPEGMQWDCDETGHCFIPGMCFLPKDCTEAETFCNAETHRCDSGCLFDFDCKTFSKICDTTTTPGTCIRRPCTGNFQCSCGEVCDLDKGECMTAEGKYCEVCDPQKENSCGDEAVKCVGFQDKEGKDLGSFCMPPCSSDKENPCPQGWQCNDLKNQDGTSAGKVCVRHCYKKVAGGCAMGDAPDPVETGDGVTADAATADAQ